MKHSLPAFAAVTALVLPLCLEAAPATEMIFDETVAADLPVGTRLVYDYEKTVPEQPEAEADPEAEVVTGFAEGEVSLTLVEGPEEARGAEMVLTRDGAGVELPVMPTSGGNPLVVVFLEQVARSTAGLSGGSPFYVRNRMKEALLSEGEQATETVSPDGTEAQVDSVTLTPLAGDPNADRMRGFDTLTVTFSYGDDIPGGIYALTAELLNTDGVPVYREAMTFEREEGRQ